MSSSSLASVLGALHTPTIGTTFLTETSQAAVEFVNGTSPAGASTAALQNSLSRTHAMTQKALAISVAAVLVVSSSCLLDAFHTQAPGPIPGIRPGGSAVASAGALPTRTSTDASRQDGLVAYGVTASHAPAVQAAIPAAGSAPKSASYARLSPYSAIRWQAGIPEVKLSGTWYTLRFIDRIAASGHPGVLPPAVWRQLAETIHGRPRPGTLRDGSPSRGQRPS